MDMFAREPRVAPEVVSLGKLLDVDLTRYFTLTRQGRLRKRDMVKCLQALARREGIDLRELAAMAA